MLRTPARGRGTGRHRRRDACAGRPRHTGRLHRAAQRAPGGPACAVARHAAARWTSSRSTPPRKGTGTSSAASKRAPCCSARSRARSTPCSAGRPRTACCAVSRCGSCPATSTGSTATPGRIRNTARRAYGYDPAYGGQGEAPSALEHAFALGTARSLGVLFEAPLDGRPGDEAVADDDILWMPVPPGSVQYGASYSAEAAGDLLVDPELWQQMVNQQYRLLSAVDRWIEQLERAHEDRTAAGIKAGETVRERADQALMASIGRRTGRAQGARRTGRRRHHLRGLPHGRGGGRYHAHRAAEGRRRQRPDHPGRTDRGQLADPDPRGPAPAAAGGGRTSGPWWAIAPSPAPRWRCCGAAAATRRSTRSPGCGCASARTTPRNSNRAPSCSTARCRNGP